MINTYLYYVDSLHDIKSATLNLGSQCLGKGAMKLMLSGSRDASQIGII